MIKAVMLCEMCHKSVQVDVPDSVIAAAMAAIGWTCPTVSFGGVCPACSRAAKTKTAYAAGSSSSSSGEDKLHKALKRMWGAK